MLHEKGKEALQLNVNSKDAVSSCTVHGVRA